MRTFSEEEARAVFARAAREAPAADDLGGERLTLDELVEIGRASGLDPERVALAAAGLGIHRSAPSETRLGVPKEIRHTRVLPGPLTDDAWAEVVASLRATFGGPGAASQIGRVREWTSRSAAEATASNVAVTATPLPDGRTEVTIMQMSWEANAAVPLIMATLFGLVTLVGFLVRMDEALFALAIFGTLAVVSGIGGTLVVRAWARRLDTRFEAALDRVELAARTDAEAQPAATPARPDAPAEARLDLNLLDNDPSAERTATRTRTR